MTDAPRCLVCGSPACLIKPIEQGWHIHKCSRCRLEFCDPMPSQGVFDTFYGRYSDPRAAEGIVRLNSRRQIKMLSEFGLDGSKSLLDFGSGRGAFCEVGQSTRWTNYDPYTRDSDTSVLGPDGYDWITLWGVLEHVPDPRGLFRDLGRWLRPGGHVALTTVGVDTAIPFQYKPPEHVTYWSREAIELLGADHEMGVRRFAPYVMKQSAEVYLNAVLRTVPDQLRRLIHHDLPEIVEVPTNEILVVLQSNATA